MLGLKQGEDKDEKLKNSSSMAFYNASSKRLYIKNNYMFNALGDVFTNYEICPRTSPSQKPLDNKRTEDSHKSQKP